MVAGWWLVCQSEHSHSAQSHKSNALPGDELQVRVWSSDTAAELLSSLGVRGCQLQLGTQQLAWTATLCSCSVQEGSRLHLVPKTSSSLRLLIHVRA